MLSPFRKRHLLHLLTTFQQQTLPLDIFLRIYFKQNKSIGSHDRKYLAETIYRFIRWKGLVDFFCKEDLSWENRISILDSLTPEDHLEDLAIPLDKRLSFPLEYLSYLINALGEEKAKEFCLESNYPAPTTLRTNLLKTSRESLLKKLETQFPCFLGSESPSSIHLAQRSSLFTLTEFKEGLFEVQDEASQIVATQVEASPGDHVLDYCCGAGGKALAIAPSMQGKGQMYLHDIRTQVFAEAKKRLKRAGIQNAQFILPSDKKKKFIGKMDWVLADVPCSGSGTLRRNPDMKWHFQTSDIKELTQKQREIFEKALSFVKHKGHIVYATCSVLPEENDEQVDFFLKNFPVQLVKVPFRSFPKKGKMDGFYAATLQKT